MKLLKSLLVAATLFVASAANAVVPSVCTGSIFNPITDTDWNNMFPITIAGMRLGGNSNPPLMQAMPPVCVCPTIFGIPMVGIGITYWQPLYIAEIEHRPGCLSSLGGLQVLSSYSLLASEQSVSDNGNHGHSSNRMQIHWYEYPVFGVMDMLKSLGCKSSSGVNLAYVTEVDPMWQDDAWGSIFSPESVLFANPLAIAACAVDAATSGFHYPMDSLFWCAGTWGTVYPMTGNAINPGDAFSLNNNIGAKFLARAHRTGLNWQTIGPSAICSSHPNPIWVKTQYRYNQVAPVKRRGRPVVTGAPASIQFPLYTNLPTKEHTINLIWQGQQCCVKAIP